MASFQTISDDNIENNTFICRACLHTVDINNDLFNLNYESEIVSEIFQKCTSIQLEITSNLPKHICKSCLSDLIGCYRFIKKCQANNGKLEAEQSSKTPSIKIENYDMFVDENNSEDGEVITLSIVNDEISSKSVQKPIKSNNLTTNKQPYACKVCQEAFSERSFLEAHELCHEFDDDDFLDESKKLSDSVEIKFNDNNKVLPKLLDKLISNSTICCEICDKSFSEQTELIEHYKSTHSNQEIFTCSNCDKIFNNQNLLNIHFRSFHTDFECEVCGKHFEYKFRLTNHMNEHIKNVKIYPCNKCGKSFKWLINFNNHFCYKKSPTTLTTNVDRIEEGELEMPKDSHQFLIVKETDEDGDGFVVVKKNLVLVESKQEFRRFRVGDNSPRPYKCTVCDKTFKQLAHVTTHQRIHTGAKPYKCSQCERPFMYLASAKFHLKRAHGIKYQKGMNLIEKFTEKKLTYEKSEERSKVRKCEICGLILHSASLKYHLMTHTGERNFMCEICGKTFIQKHLFDDHRIRHTNEKPHTCQDCGRTFRALTSLKEHSQKHKINNAVRCEVCKKIFYSEKALLRHQINHDKRFLCGMCGKRFSNHTQLNEHNNIHLGLKPYRCNICHRAFSKKRQLKYHMYVHTGNKPFVCTICNRAFVRRYRVAEHCKTVHGVDLNELKEVNDESSTQQEEVQL